MARLKAKNGEADKMITNHLAGRQAAKKRPPKIGQNGSTAI
jgi:hypothetical protein